MKEKKTVYVQFESMKLLRTGKIIKRTRTSETNPTVLVMHVYNNNNKLVRTRLIVNGGLLSESEFDDVFVEPTVTRGQNTCSFFAERRVIIVCTVLVCRTWKVKKNNYGMTVPPGKADTTVSPNGRVYVKYNDFETYPLFLVYYRRPDSRLSRYFSDPNTSTRFAERHADAKKPEEDQLRRQREEERREQEKQRRKWEAYERQQEFLWQQEQLRQFTSDVYRQQLRNVEATRDNGCLIL